MLSLLIMMCPSYQLHGAVETRNFAVGLLMSVVFKLNGRVTNPIALFQHGFERPQHRRALAGRQISNGGVTGKGVHATSDAPYMQIMDILYPFHAHHVAYQFGERDVFGNCFQQDIGRFTQDAPGSYGNKNGNANGKNGVSRIPTGEENHGTRYDDCHTCSYIAKDVQGGCPDV